MNIFSWLMTRNLSAPSNQAKAADDYEICRRLLGAIRELCTRDEPGEILEKLGLTKFQLTKIIQLCHGIADHIEYSFDDV